MATDEAAWNGRVYLDLDAKWRPMPAGLGDERCAECGMPVLPQEYHPHTACLLFLSLGLASSVRANLYSVAMFASHIEAG